MTEPLPTGICVLIDGECPICDLYGRHVAANVDPDHARIVDGRLDSEEKRRSMRAGFDIDQGMVAITPDGMIAGREAMIYIARHVRPGDSWLLAICARVFRYRWPAVLAYPVFKAVRRAALWLKGVGPLR